MDSEESPLLPSDQDNNVVKHEAVYRRFSPAKKRLIVGMVSICGLIPCESRLSNPLIQLIIYLTIRFHHSIRDRLIYTRHSNNRKGAQFYGPNCEASPSIVVFLTNVVMSSRFVAWLLVYRHLVHH